MTDRKQALADLIAKVEAGGENRFSHSFLDEVRAWRSPLEYFEVCNHVHAAFHGSLDAAKALHEAVLPECDWIVGSDYRGDEPCAAIEGHCVDVEAFSDTPARAWLIAIIKTLIAMEKDNG